MPFLVNLRANSAFLDFRTHNAHSLTLMMVQTENTDLFHARCLHILPQSHFSPARSVVVCPCFISGDTGTQRGEWLVRIQSWCIWARTWTWPCWRESSGPIQPYVSVMLFTGLIDPWPWPLFLQTGARFSGLGSSVQWHLLPNVVSDFGRDSFFSGSFLSLYEYKSFLFYVVYFWGTFQMDCSSLNLVLPVNQTTGQIAQFWIWVRTHWLAVWPGSSYVTLSFSFHICKMEKIYLCYLNWYSP